MNLSDSISRHEGYRRTPYKDHLGKWTVGTGHLIHDQDLKQFEPKRTVGGLLDFLSDPENHARWLKEDIAQAQADADRFLEDDFNALNPAQQDVVVEMAFQMGLTRLSGFKKFKQAIADRDWQQARAEMLDSKWAQQTPERANRLANRFYS